MIIYPIIILASLVAAFVIVWRRASLVEKQGEIPLEEIERNKGEKIEEHSEPGDIKKPVGVVSHLFHRRDSLEEDINIQEEMDPVLLKAEDLFKKRQFISAERWYLESIKKDPKNPKIYARLGVIYTEQKNYKDAIASFEEAVKFDQTVPSRFFNLSFVYNAEGDKRQAVANAKRALRLDPKNKRYRRWLEELKQKPF